MKRRRALLCTSWLIAIIAVGWAVRECAQALAVDPLSGAPSISEVPPLPRMQRGSESAEDAGRIRDQNPFRLERVPTDHAFGRPPPIGQQPDLYEYIAPTFVLPSPTLMLSAVVGGPPWRAVVEGIPGREPGALLSVGDEVGGIRLDWISGDSVQLTTSDSTIVISLKRPWR